MKVRRANLKLNHHLFRLSSLYLPVFAQAVDELGTRYMQRERAGLQVNTAGKKCILP